MRTLPFFPILFTSSKCSPFFPHLLFLEWQDWSCRGPAAFIKPSCYTCAVGSGAPKTQGASWVIFKGDPSGNTQYSLAEAEKGLKSTALVYDARAPGQTPYMKDVFSQSRKWVLEAANGKIWFGKHCPQPATEVFYLQRAMASTPVPGENKTLPAHTMAAFPVHWPEHAITAP